MYKQHEHYNKAYFPGTSKRQRTVYIRNETTLCPKNSFSAIDETDLGELAQITHIDKICHHAYMQHGHQ